MSIVYNNTTIDTVKYNDTTLDTVNYNNTEVFSGTKTLTVNKGSYISSIIINGTTYTSNTTVNIKPGTSVILNCTPNGNSTSGDIITTYSFSNWTGYTTNTSKSFTFIMPNNNVTYTANGTYSTSFSWPEEGNIPEDTFLAGINAGSYDTSLEGRYVTLTEGSSTHNWLIIRVNTDSYDLWYKGSIGNAKWKGSDSSAYWINNSSTDTTYVRGLCNSYRSKLSSSIRAKLKTGLNANCGSDKVVILSKRQLGNTSDILEASDSTSNTPIPYFYGHSVGRRNIGSYYWTSSVNSGNGISLWRVDSGGFTSTYYYYGEFGVVPAIRVG